MTKTEFEKRIETEKLIIIHDGRVEKSYINAEHVYNEDGEWICNIPNVYGCFENKKTGIFLVFITDSERGIPNYISKFESEEEAYDELYNKITRLERIYLKKYGSAK